MRMYPLEDSCWFFKCCCKNFRCCKSFITPGSAGGSDAPSTDLRSSLAGVDKHSRRCRYFAKKCRNDDFGRR
eukprot:11237789-Prorocentrum_lima.AAC.1